MTKVRRAALRRTVSSAAAAALVGALVVAVPATAHAATVVTVPFAYTGATATWTVPSGVSSLNVTVVGAEGGRGGTDAAGPPPPGGYQGVVTGTMAVTPGQVLTIAVGQGGASGAAGHGSNVPANYTVGTAVGGSNPLNAYRGANGGAAGPIGSSGFGGAGGAATVVTTSGSTLVAGGSGGSGGSGQFSTVKGRLSYPTFTGRSDAISTDGQVGVTVAPICTAIPGNNCDGGAGGGGGGGVQGGAQGTIEFGSGSSLEWFGYGGYPGQSSTAGLSGLSTSYQFYADNNANGSVTLSYTAGAPDAPTAVGGVAGDSSVDLAWTAPLAVGETAVSDYVVEYAPSSAPTSWTTVADGVSTATSATVTGLTNGTSYIFRVAAVNTAGTGGASAPSSAVTPFGIPTAPTISSISPADARLSVAFGAAASGGPLLDYEYQLDGTGPWVSSGSSASPLAVTGLTNGTAYSVTIRAVNAIGAGPPSSPVSATPTAPAGAPTITTVTTGVGTAVVAFAAGYDGGSAITGYEYRLDSGSWVSAATTSSPVTITGLTDGTTYAITIRAVTAAGAGAASATSTVTTPDVPGAPVLSSVTGGDASLSIAFTPGNSNGSAISAFQYQLTSGGSWTTAPSLSSPIAVVGLTNGTTYDVRVRAVSAVGTGPASSSLSATPATVPGAPTIVGNTVAGSDAQLSAAFNAPASNGGSAITTYDYSTDGGATWRARASGGTGSPVVIATESGDGTTALVNGTTYFVELRAVNAVGPGQASAVAVGIARTTPAAPTISSLTPGPSSLEVTFTPASNGGAAITAYQYRLGSGGWVSTGTLGSTFLVTGLTNGTGYAVSVRAVNSQGPGAASASVPGTPRTTPGQPSITGVTRGDRTLSVSVAAAGTGGSALTGWEYSTDGGTTWRSAGTATSPLSVTTLSSDGSTRIANGSTYPVTVRVLNAAGASAPSAITTVGPGTTPAAPTVTLTPLNGSAQAGFALSNDGGSPVSAVQYRVDGGTWTDAGTLSSPFVIGSLTNGTAYSVQVRAVNVLGAGTASAGASVTPRTVPDPPTAVTALSNTSSADTAWTLPGDDGGAAITSYVATAYATASSTTPVASCTTATTGCAVSGLSNGTAYFVSVVAQNAAGASLPSAPRAVVTPLARPGAPTLSSITSGNTSLSVAFSAGSAGSSPITGYQYQLNGGAWTNATGTGSPISVSGLGNGTGYAVALRAVNAAGPGPASAPLSGTPYTFPDAPAPATIVVDGQNARVAVSWVAPNNNGSAITSYTATAFTLAAAGSPAGTCTTATLACTITGLTNGTTYYVSVQAQNAAGLSVRSDPRVPTTPSFLPGAVSAVTGVSGDGQVRLSWTAGSTGASAITDYTVWYASGAGYTQFADGVSTATSATVTGLLDGTPYTFLVYAVNTNGTGPASPPSAPVTPLAPGTVPTASALTSTVDGFVFTITNYDPATTYSLSASNGATVTRSGPTVTVTGLGAGGFSAVSVSAALAGHTVTALGVSGSALLVGIAPTFSTPVRSAAGYSVQISNFVPSATYSFSVTNGATVTVAGSSITISGLPAGSSSDVTVTIARVGYTSAFAVASGAALALGTAPTMTGVTATVDGYSFVISNFSAGLDYSFAATGGATVTRMGSTIVVSGLAPGAGSDVTVTATDPGVSTASAVMSGSALLSGTAPVLSSPVRADGGFAFEISNFDAAYTYTLTGTVGATVTLTGSSADVTGLAAGGSADVAVVASRTGYTTTFATVFGAALDAGTTPMFSTPTSTGGGFTFTITNYDPVVTYVVSAPAGAVVSRSGGTVTVTGLAPSASASVTVDTSQPGHLAGTASVTGSASPSAPTPAPTDSAPTSSPTPTPADTAPTSAPTRSSGSAGGTHSASTGQGPAVDGAHVTAPVLAAGIATIGSSHGSGPWWLLTASVLLPLLVLFFMVAWRRRRSDEDDRTRTPAG